MTISRIQACYQSLKKHLILAKFSNSPWTGILEGEFPEGEIAILPKTDQFRLMATEQVLRQIDELVAATRQRRNLSG